MTAASGRRIAKLAELVSAEARKQRRGLQPAFGDRVIRYHAIAAAAIALEGLPKIDEPLIEAWNRVLRHFKIELKNPHLFEGQIEAAWELWPKIQNHEDESTRLTEIFSTAPAWFLQFTRLPLDARHLKFDLPRHLMTAVEWGSAGFEEARLWPQPVRNYEGRRFDSKP